MATYVQLEKSLFGSRPVELYRFSIVAPGEPEIGDFDDDFPVETDFIDLAAMETYGWEINQSVCSLDLEDPVKGVANIAPGLDGTIISCHTAANPPITATATFQVPLDYTPGTQVWASFDWQAQGHWFEPMGFTISSGASHKSAGFNPSSDGEIATGSRVTGKITVDSSGIVLLQVTLNSGYPIIGHDDSYVLENLHVYAIAPDEGDGDGGTGGPGDETVYGFTSYKNEWEFDGGLYTPLEINRGVIDVGGEDKPGALSVTLPSDSEIGTLLRQGLSYALMSLQIIRLQQDAPDDPAYIFDGQVANFDDQDDVMTLTCVPLPARLQDVVPQELVQKDQCPWHTGDPFTCRVDLSLFTFTGTVSAISTNGLEITVTGAEDFVPDLVGATTLPDMFVFGTMRKGVYEGAIEAQDGDVLTLAERLPTLEVGDDVELVAGDDRTKQTCKNKFQNIDRFGAFSELPSINPAYGQNLRP
jgi:hypothetical protein